ncbi:MAG: carbon-nitrogen hydrolase family protein [Gemmatimonadota bacterium]
MPARAVALVQFDAPPEQVEANLARVVELTRRAAGAGARWVLFHEGTLCDYTPRLAELAQAVPDGPATAAVARLAADCGCFVSFGLSESAAGRYFIAQVFVGPHGYVHHYRKTWLWRDQPDGGYRNEWARYDPGTGPEAFLLDGVRATCFICADGEAPRCLERAAALRPQVVFYPNNRGQLPDYPVFGDRARQIGAPMLVTNRVGASWVHACRGGCVAYGADGQVLAAANRDGREEILHLELQI